MDTDRLSRLAATLADPRGRRETLRLLLGTALGGGALALAGADPAAAKKCSRGKKKCNGKCIRKNRPCRNPVPADRCPTASVCNTEPNACGTTAGSGEACSCDRSIEGNNVCTNFTETCNGLKACTSTDGNEATSCRNQVGFHYFCMKPKTDAQGRSCGCGQVCLPECDNPS